MNIIEKAIASLPGHWIKGHLEIGDSHCAIGHLAKAARDSILPVPLEHLTTALASMSAVVLEQYPDRLEGSDLGPIAQFNDHPDTTETEVLAVMEKASVKFNEHFDSKA